jgi:tetratricopeptide (TPR) repeat protein
MKNKAELIKGVELLLKEGKWDQASRILARAIEQLGRAPTEEKDKKLLAEALRLKAFADSRRGEHTKAVFEAKKAMNISRAIGDLEGEADALRRLGYVHWQKADHQLAQEFYVAALDKAERCGAKRLLGLTKIELGNNYGSMGDLPKAKRVFLDAIKVLEGENELAEVGRAYNNLGATHKVYRTYKEAVQYLEKAIEVNREAGSITTMGWATFNMAECMARLGRAKEALVYLDSAKKILAEVDDKVGLATTFMIYGIVHTALEQWDLAMGSFDKAIKLEKRLQMPSLEAEILQERGRMYAAKGEREKAVEDLRMAMDLFTSHEQPKDAEYVKDLLDQLGA